MTPDVKAAQGRIFLHFGSCKAQLDTEEALQLRAQLLQQFDRYLKGSNPRRKAHWQQLEEQLQQAQILGELESLPLQQLLRDYPREQLVPLLRVLHQERPALSERLFNLLSRRSSQQLLQEMRTQPPTPLQQVLAALESLQETLASQGLLTGTRKKARDYLQRLAQLPEAALDTLTASLQETSAQKLRLLAQQLQVPDLEKRLKHLEACRLPKSAQPETRPVMQESRLQEPMQEQQLRLLLAEVSQALKKLRQSKGGG